MYICLFIWISCFLHLFSLNKEKYGNATRRFFSNPPATAKTTKINNHVVIKVFEVSLFILWKGHEGTIYDFESYRKRSFLSYKKLPIWYALTSTVHKVLQSRAYLCNINTYVSNVGGGTRGKKLWYQKLHGIFEQKVKQKAEHQRFLFLLLFFRL